MPHNERDMSYLWDIRKYALEITEIIKGVPHAKFVENKTIRYAIERLLLIVGEAANHVSKEFQDEHPEIEWAQIIGLRNILAHEYGEVKMDKIYLAATKAVPAGSGTRLALEDAIALFGALETRGSVPAGLAAFEAERRPKADDLQAAAQVSMEWFENAGKDMGLHPMELAWVLMTRSGKIDRENLARRDPAFVAAYEAWKAGGGA